MELKKIILGLREIVIGGRNDLYEEFIISKLEKLLKEIEDRFNKIEISKIEKLINECYDLDNIFSLQRKYIHKFGLGRAYFLRPIDVKFLVPDYYKRILSEDTIKEIILKDSLVMFKGLEAFIRSILPARFFSKEKIEIDFRRDNGFWMVIIKGIPLEISEICKAIGQVEGLYHFCYGELKRLQLKEEYELKEDLKDAEGLKERVIELEKKVSELSEFELRVRDYKILIDRLLKIDKEYEKLVKECQNKYSKKEFWEKVIEEMHL